MNVLNIYIEGIIFCTIYNYLKLLFFVDYNKYIHLTAKGI
jgi:hypothetical protein